MSNNNIPDISYHLIFCFLTLKELPLVSQCSKEFKRIVTAPSFLNMFHHNDVFEIKNLEQIDFASTNPLFSRMIRKIKIRCFGRSRFCFPFFTTSYLIYFYRITSFEWLIDFDDNPKENYHFDITPVFQALGSRLNNLKIELNKWHSTDVPPSFQIFQSALSLLTSLQSLVINTCGEEIFTDFSFISHMKQLKSFESDVCHDDNCHELFDHLRSCHNLTHLSLIDFFDYGLDDVHRLNKICEAFEHSNITHLGFLGGSNIGIPQEQESWCSNLLKKLTHLQTINIEITDFFDLTPIFNKWIRHLSIEYTNLDDETVSFIIGLSNLKSLQLYYFMVMIRLEYAN